MEYPRDSSLARRETRSIMGAPVWARYTPPFTPWFLRRNEILIPIVARRLARPLSDVGFGRIREQLRYKAALYGTHLIQADPWYPSSKLCSTPGCDFKHQELKLSERSWLCPHCGVRHDRDVNAARNLKRLATATALPVAKLAGNGAAGEGTVPSTAGKVTSVRYERGAVRSGQKKNRAHLCALS